MAEGNAAAPAPEVDDASAKVADRINRIHQESLRPCHALGLRPPRGKRIGGKVVEHTSDDTIVYLVGKHVAIYSYEQSAHRFIPKGPKTLEIITFAVSFNRRYIALSEKVVDDKTGEVGMQVSIYNFNTASRVRTLSLSYLNKLPVEALDFSRDNKYLITATGSPEPYLYLWQLDKARLLQMTELHVEITQVSISPWAHWTMCTTGTSSLRVWRFQEKQLRSVDPIPKRSKDYHFTCHTWFDDERLMVGTQEGDVLIIENCELKRVLQNIFVADGDDPIPIWAIHCIGRGFFCGGDHGAFALYERTYDAEYFQPYKSFNTPDRLRIIDISVSPNEESLVCCYENNELGLFNLTNVDILDHNSPDEVAQAFRRLPIGFHYNTVTAMDVCIQKSIVVTASTDRQVRIWNFLRRRLEIRKEFPEEVLSISCHPTGTRLLVGFKAKMNLYSVLIDNLHFCHEFPIKQCREVRFSHGGQYFAAVVVNRIFLFNAYTFEAIGHLTGHSSMVKSLTWSRNDQTIISAGFEGAVYEWRTESCKRNEICEYVCKAIAYSVVRSDDTSGLVATVGSHKVTEGGVPEGDVTLRVLKLNEAQGSMPRSIARLGTVSTKHSHTRSHTGEIAISAQAQCLFAGTPSGELQIFRWPLPTGTAAPDITIDLHQGEIHYVLLSTDERYLFTVGEDHCMFMFDVDTLLEGKVPSRRNFNYGIFDDVALVLQQDVDDRVREVGQLQGSLLEEQRLRKHERQEMADHFTSQMEQLRNETQEQIAKMKKERDDALEHVARSEARMSEEAQMLEATRTREVQELEALHSKRAKDQQAKYEQLLEEKGDLIVRYENKVHKLQKEREADCRSYERQIEELQQQLSREVDSVTREHQEAIKEAADILKDTEDEHEEELEVREKRWKERLEEEEKERLRAQSEVDGYRRRQEKHDLQVKELEMELLEQKEKIRKKEARIAEQEKAIQALRLEINVRNDTISASEKKILELKKQTAELEKLRYVLTFKFNELRKEVAPKEDNIKSMNERIQQMDAELEKVGIDRDTLQQAVAGRENKIQVIMKEVARLNRQADDRNRQLQMLLRELNDLVSEADPKNVVLNLRDVIEKYTNKFQRAAEPDSRGVAEFEKQRFYIEAQLATLKKQNQRRENHMHQDSQRKTGENSLLVKEINELRHEKKTLLQKLQLADSHLKEMRQATQRHSLQPLTKKPQSPDSRSGRTSPLPEPSPTRGLAGRVGVPGKLHRGGTRSVRDLAKMDPAKVAEVIQQVERNHIEMMKQQEEIQRLRDFVQHLLCKETEGQGETHVDPNNKSPSKKDEDSVDRLPEL